MIGVPCFCAECGTPLRSCTLPAYCFDCDPIYKDLREKMKAQAQEGFADIPIVVDSPKREET